MHWHDLPEGTFWFRAQENEYAEEALDMMRQMLADEYEKTPGIVRAMLMDDGHHKCGFVPT